jgi:hypothetical protein
MQYRLRTLLTQFSIRDLCWLFLLAAVISYAYKERLAMNSKIAAQKTQQQTQLEQETKQRKNAELAAMNAKTATAIAEASMNEWRQRYRRERDVRIREWNKLPLWYPVYYPPSVD